MSELNTVVDELRSNATRLVESYAAVQEENKNLKEELDQLKKQLNEQSADVVKLKEEVKMQHLAGSLNGDGSKEVKLRINELVREIDKCIAQLNQ